LLGHRNITVITNNMNVANTLVANPGCEIVVAGGALRRTDGGLVGELTTQFFEQFKVDYAVIGVSALDRDGDLLDFDLAEVRVSKAIIRQARKVFLVCDHSKLDRSAPARLASLSEITTLFTDQPLPADLMRKCDRARRRLVDAVVGDQQLAGAAGDRVKGDAPRLGAAQAFGQAGDAFDAQEIMGEFGVRGADVAQVGRDLGAPEQLGAQPVAPRARAQQAVDQHLHRVNTIAVLAHLGGALRLRQQKMVHPADPGLGVPDAGGDARAEDGRQCLVRVAGDAEFALHDLSDVIFLVDHRPVTSALRSAQRASSSAPIRSSGSCAWAAPISHAARGMP
jgi:hypothetical protein